MPSPNEITEILDAIRTLTGIGICMYDFTDYFAYNAIGFRKTTGHYCDFCRAARELPDGRRICNESDRSEAVRFAAEYREPYFHTCHMGLRELVIPILQEDHLLGLFFLGQCRIEGAGQAGEDSVRRRAEALGGIGEAFAGLYRRLPLISETQLAHWGRILFICFKEFVKDRESMQRLIPDSVSVDERIARYIDANYAQPITLGSICEALFISRSWAAHRFNAVRGMTVTQYIILVRLEHARRLLCETRLPVGNIAMNCGFPDAGYFSRVFRRETGMTPGQYRASHRLPAGNG